MRFLGSRRKFLADRSQNKPTPSSPRQLAGTKKVTGIITKQKFGENTRTAITQKALDRIL